jgi:hypothetical protein
LRFLLQVPKKFNAPLNALFRAGKKYRRRWPENMGSEDSPIKRNEKKMALRKGFFNY